MSGSGANFLACMFLSWREGIGDLGGEDRCPTFRSGGCFQWFEVELLLLDFLCQLNAPNRHGRRLESLELEHRPDPLLYSPVILLDHVVQSICRIAPGRGAVRFRRF
jgi:hypothetical protein